MQFPCHPTQLSASTTKKNKTSGNSSAQRRQIVIENNYKRRKTFNKTSDKQTNNEQNPLKYNELKKAWMKGNKGEDDETRCNAMETSQIRELIRIHYFKSLKCIRNVYTHMNGERREGERVN